jgi:hypothetical protein
MPPKKATVVMKKPHMVVQKVKPPGMADEDWVKELAWHAVVTTDQNKRRVI